MQELEDQLVYRTPSPPFGAFVFSSMSPICDTSWTRETLRKNKIIRSRSSSGSFPTSPDSGTASPSPEPPPTSSSPPPFLSVSSATCKTDATLKGTTTTATEEGGGGGDRQPTPSRRRGKAPAPPTSSNRLAPRTPSKHRAPPPPLPISPIHTQRKETGHFAFRGFKLGQRVTKGVEGGISKLGQAVSRGKGGGSSSHEDITTHTQQEPPSGGVSRQPQYQQQELSRPEPGRGSRGANKTEVNRPKKLALDKIGVRLPGLAVSSSDTGPHPTTTRPPSLAKTPSGDSSNTSSPSGTPSTVRRGVARQGQGPEKRATPYRKLIRLLGRESAPSTPPGDTPGQAPAHALFLRDNPHITNTRPVCYGWAR
ncbi:hypothetical protein Pcinc_034278 [Petrolisthes cinctipes]|uniref:Uncharacterized protein n=1 Tax=Petrolisthes cinctipes TaxID=88211 RepID=A0AAE1EQK1_PETCI|nr:hypothetical protein Pcinc_034278 [Petrolisthes cinctipes]